MRRHTRLRFGMRTRYSVVTALALFATGVPTRAEQSLPSWNDGAARRAIVEFVEWVTNDKSTGFVPANERIAAFDNDGTLWSEQPLYFQAIYTFDRIRELSPQHEEWKREEPFASVLRGDVKGALAGGERALVTMLMSTHAGLTAEEFRSSATKWLSSARHPTTGKPFTSMVYQPMLELLDYLRDHDFKVFIVSGGGIDFVRAFSEEVYGIPRERVVGSSLEAKYEVRDGKPVVVKLPEIDLIDDHAGKPVGIHRHIGRRPLIAIGNSDGDFEMLEWTTAGKGPRLGVILHHTDAEREWAYDRESHIGKLDKALDAAPGRGWILIDMKQDWKRVYPF